MDVRSLSSAVAFGKLPVLKHLSLSCNTLTQCLGDLFGCVFPRLRRLYVNNAQLCGIDMKSLCKAVEDGKIPKLKVLNLSDNNLTDTVADLLATDYLTLKKLWLCNSRLSEGDIISLSAAFREDKLKGLTDLTLVGNNLKNQLRNLFGDFEGFSSLKRLRLRHCQLGKDDIECMLEAVIHLCLRLLDFRENCLSLGQVEHIADIVAEDNYWRKCAATAERKKATCIKVLVSVNDFSENNCEKITAICANSLIGRKKIVQTMEVHPMSLP